MLQVTYSDYTLAVGVSQLMGVPPPPGTTDAARVKTPPHYTTILNTKYTVYGRHLQANVGQCRNGDDELLRISFAVTITITQGLTQRRL